MSRSDRGLGGKNGYDMSVLVDGCLYHSKKDVWFTSEEITQYLSQHFISYEKGSEENFKAFTPSLV